MTMTGADVRQLAEKDARMAELPPVVRRMTAIREQMGQLDRVLDELRDSLEPVLLEGPSLAFAGTMEQVANTSSMGADLDQLAGHLSFVVERVRTLAAAVDL